MKKKRPPLLCGILGVTLIWAVTLITSAVRADDNIVRRKMMNNYQKLFPTNLPEREWLRFEAEGFTAPVNGMIFTTKRTRSSSGIEMGPPINGMPLGVIDTGCIDLEVDGTFGLCTLFNSHVPRRLINRPFLGISVEGQPRLLTKAHSAQDWICYWESDTPKLRSLPRDPLREIYYWGHYPVVDVEYDLQDTPVSVGLRAWAPFIPGDINISLLPGAVFEVHLRNVKDTPQRGTVAFSFPGPSDEESEDATIFSRKSVDGIFSGISVTNSRDIGYALGVVGDEKIRSGGELGINGEAWANIENKLPEAKEYRSGSSLAVDFSLAPRETKIVRFVLGWYSPRWKGGGTPTAGGNTYTHMYTTRYRSALEAAKCLAENHESLLKRILAWQQVIYTDEKLPSWLQDSLLNGLNLITENSMWAVAEPPIGEWCRKEDGIFGMNESPKYCPQIECLPPTFEGNIPIVYFFPELALSTLRAFKAYQSPEGATAFMFSGFSYHSPPCGMVSPTTGWQTATNGPQYVDIVNRYWNCTGDDEMLKEFYESVKQTTIYTMNLRPDLGPDGIISVAHEQNASVLGFAPGFGTDWIEMCEFHGMTAHVAGIHLAQLKMAERMAEEMGDEEFADQCRDWFAQGSNSLENKLWTGNYYLNYYEPTTGKKSDLILAYQLDGEWMARSEGLDGVFRNDRVKTTLETIKQTNVALTDFGALNYANPDGTPVQNIGFGTYTVLTCYLPFLAMMYMYEGEPDFGLELVRRDYDTIIKQGFIWSAAGGTRGDKNTGEVFGDYGSHLNLILWGLPAALNGEDLSGPAKPGGLADRILQAARGG